MKAQPSLLAVLLMLSSTSLAQTAPTQQAAPVQQAAAAPTQEATPVQQAAPTQEAVPVQQTVPVQEASPVQDAAPVQRASPVQETAPTQQAVPVQEAAPVQDAAPVQQAVPSQQAAEVESAKPEAAKPEAEGLAPTPSTSPTPATPSSEADETSKDEASVGALLAAPSAPVFAPGAKIFIAPMNGFEQFLSEAILKKKVPVVVVKDRAEADFLVSGGARVKKRGFFTGMVLNDHGGGDISINDAQTGKPVFACTFNRVDQGLAEGYVYQGWASNCMKRLKKEWEKK
jgi:hypothetical protein